MLIENKLALQWKYSVNIVKSKKLKKNRINIVFLEFVQYNRDLMIRQRRPRHLKKPATARAFDVTLALSKVCANVSEWAFLSAENAKK